MNTKNDFYTQFGPLGYMFKWIDDHRTLTNIILALESVAIAYAVLTYNFTTNF